MNSNSSDGGKRKIKAILYWFIIVLWFISILLAIGAVRMVSWVFHNWGNLRADELIFTMSNSLEGTNPAMISDAIFYVVPYIIIGIVVFSVVYVLIRKRKLLKRIIIITTSVISVATITITVLYFLNKIGYFEYIKNQNTYSSFIDNNYVSPESVSIEVPEKKRNLIYIFVESMEISFADSENGGGCSKNIIPELTQIAKENETFAGKDNPPNGGYALYGSTYTMGGLFAQTSGLPLGVTPDDIATQEGFLPGLCVIGDILESAGYNNMFCIGTDASFSKRGDYFSTHGNYEILDYNYSVENSEISSDYSRDWWGYDDFTLYDNAKKHILNAAKSDKPFNFTMLTVDTHAEDGYICKLCKNEFNDQYSDVIACANRQVAEFVEWIQEQDFYDNTTIVICGDHCTMDSNYASNISPDYKRKTYTVYINAAIEPVNDAHREYSTMDIFPTTLAALGFKISGDRLGLGTNLFSDKQTLLEEYGYDKVNNSIALKTDFFKNKMGDKIQRDVVVSYDDTKTNLLIDIGNIDYTGDYDGVLVEIKYSAPHIQSIYSSTVEEEDGENHISIPVEAFYMDSGDYLLTISLQLPGNLTSLYYSENLSLDASDQGYYYRFDEDQKNLNFSFFDDIESSEISIPVWNSENEQDDLVWYTPENDGKGNWTTTIDMNYHEGNGLLFVEIYKDGQKNRSFIISR